MKQFTDRDLSPAPPRIVTPVRHIVLFFVLAYGISWLCWSPYVFPFFPQAWALNPVFHLLGAMGPLCAALLTVLITAGPSALRQHLMSSFSVRSWSYVIAGLLAPFAIGMLGWILSGAGIHNPFAVDTSVYKQEFGTLDPALWAIGINLVIYGFGEEGGLRGYAVPRMQERWSPLVVALLFSMLWAVWHWPLFFYQRSGYHYMDLAGVAGWFVSLVAGAVLISWIFNRSRYSIPACALFHGAMDIAFSGGQGPDVHLQYVGIVVTVLGVAAGVDLYRMRRLNGVRPE